MAKKRQGAPFTRIVQDIPATVPFLAPEAIERRSGKALTLRLGANESAFGPSPLALEAMREAAAQVNWYGDPESYDLRMALAGRHGVGMENVVIGCGIDDLLELIVRTYLETGPDGGNLARRLSYLCVPCRRLWRQATACSLS